MPIHHDVVGFRSPAIDARVDVTDQYVFLKPQDPSKTILITNVNPLAPAHADEFRHDAVYETLVDTDGDARPDLSLRCRFTLKSHGRQFARVTRALLTIELEDGHIHEELETETLVENAPASFGSEPIITEGVDGVRFFAGLRSDPLFFDMLSYVDRMNFRPPGSDFFADKNVFSIALEVPNWLLGESPRIGVWVRTLLPMTRQRDHLTQFDQAGGPFVSMFFNHQNDQAIFNRTEPANQRAAISASGQSFLRSFTSRLERIGGYTVGEAEEIARTLLPDILTFDYSSPSGFPNGRRLEDDTADFMLRLLTNGAINTDHVGPHTDYLSEFPYLGNPRDPGPSPGSENHVAPLVRESADVPRSG
jgi:hypothetical protein